MHIVIALVVVFYITVLIVLAIWWFVTNFWWLILLGVAGRIWGPLLLDRVRFWFSERHLARTEQNTAEAITFDFDVTREAMRRAVKDGGS